MLNARHNFALIWKRLVAALSLVMAAALAPAMSAPAGGAGAITSRVGNGATAAGAVGAVAAKVAGLVEGRQHRLPVDTSSDGTEAKACTLAARQEPALPALAAVPPARAFGAAAPTHAARSGLTRAPPA